MTAVWATMARDIVAVNGPDAASYLQGQVSQEVEALGVGDSAWTFVLQPTGKVDGFARLWRRGEDDIVLDSDAGAGEALVARLLRFKLRVKADVSAVPGWRAIAVRGEGAATAAGPGARPGWWGSVDAPDLLGPDVSPPLGVQEIDAAAFERLRIEAGWPAVGAELTPDTIPAEAGVVLLAVSFTKGCFTGQELVARIDSRGGNVPRHLRRLRAAGGSGIEVGAPIVVAGKEVGVVTSTAGGVALGYVGRAVVPPATATAGGVDVAIEEIVPPAR